MSSSLTIRIPDDIARRLDTLARSLDRPKSYIVKKAMESYLDEYSDYLIALDRLRDKDDLIISSGELRRRLALED
jgi:RHH-type transcriptional regulator, rel operon repressor / antitoxin RelB